MLKEAGEMIKGYTRPKARGRPLSRKQKEEGFRRGALELLGAYVPHVMSSSPPLGYLKQSCSPYRSISSSSMALVIP